MPGVRPEAVAVALDPALQARPHASLFTVLIDMYSVLAKWVMLYQCIMIMIKLWFGLTNIGWPYLLVPFCAFPFLWVTEALVSTPFFFVHALPTDWAEFALSVFKLTLGFGINFVFRIIGWLCVNGLFSSTGQNEALICLVCDTAIQFICFIISCASTIFPDPLSLIGRYIIKNI